MSHVDLFDLCAAACEAGTQLGRYHRAVRAQIHRVELPTLEQFEAAIDVADGDAEQNPHQFAPCAAVDPAHQGIGARGAASGDDVIFGNEWNHALEIGVGR